MSKLKQQNDEMVDAFNTLYYALRSLTYHRAIKEVDPGESKFWAHTQSQFMRTFVMEWCKVFGTYDNKLHWIHLAKDEAGFRAHILNAVGITEAEWKIYHDEIVAFRNDYVAHVNPEQRPESVPDMTKARTILIAGYQWLRLQSIASGEEHSGPDDIETLVGELYEEALDLIGAGIEATKDMPEEN
ncbi:MAG: hypothetical protein RJQ07_14335 [Pseudomonadales bacterium]